MDLGLEGKKALVTASSTGLGRAVAEELAAEGCDLVLCARSEDTLGETADAIAEASGRTVVPVRADLTDADDIERLVDRAHEELGRVDVLFTNAGGPPSGPFESHGIDAWRKAERLLLESVVLLVQGVLPGMKERRWGRLLHLTSIAAKQPVGGLMLSNSIRAAVTGFARTLANEVAPYGITVNTLLPGYTGTERLNDLAEAEAGREGIEPEDVFERWNAEVPMGRVAEPREFAAVAAFLASERASYVTGQSVVVDGGWIRSLL